MSYFYYKVFEICFEIFVNFNPFFTNVGQKIKKEKKEHCCREINPPTPRRSLPIYHPCRKEYT